MGAEYLPQGPVEDMGRGVVALDGLSAGEIQVEARRLAEDLVQIYTFG